MLFLYHIVPWEYELYHFKSKNHRERLEYLSDADRYMCCELLMGDMPYWTLKNRFKFYNLLSKFYNRSIFLFISETSESDFNDNVLNKSNSFFVKPLDGSLGRDTFIIDSESEKKDLFRRLRGLGGCWIIEETIKQVPMMAEWNSSSVNTIRIPSIKRDGSWHILQPFFRTGRRGAIVDNAVAGGILSVVDAKTGCIITDGYDESKNVYKRHPDSHIIYKGWQIPQYDELIELTKQIHDSLLHEFIYVCFDFALTSSEWELIEGNWGQFVGQIAHQSIKSQFDKYMGFLK